MAAIAPDVEASCAICGAPPYPECPHEGQRLELALNQAMERWEGLNPIRNWVLNHARNQVILTFQQMRDMRYQRTIDYLQTLPSYTLYQTYHGNPPVQPVQLQHLHMQIVQAQQSYKAGVDEDWRRSCQRYPEILDYYFSLIEWEFPNEKDPAIQEPRFGAPAPERARKIKAAHKQREAGNELMARDHRKKERRRSRGLTPPPVVPMPMPGAFPRR